MKDLILNSEIHNYFVIYKCRDNNDICFIIKHESNIKKHKNIEHKDYRKFYNLSQVLSLKTPLSNRRQNRYCPGCWYQCVWGGCGRGNRGMNMVEVRLFMYINVKLRPAEIILGMWGSGIRENYI
jgi:hypothetical protein